VKRDPRLKFEKALCTCIRGSAPFPYVYGIYACGNFVDGIWQCARELVDKVLPPPDASLVPFV
jgi:hypothetical protein